jgi:methyl-accepting chemotaxis protein
MSWLGGVRISVKLPIIFAAVVLVTGGALALTAYRIAAVDFRAEIEDRVRDQGRERRDALAGALAAIVEDVDLNAAHPWTKRALSALANGWAALGASAPSRLWDAYVEGNPFDDDERAELDRADDDSFYSVHHETYHPWFRDLAAVRGYEDILLVNAAGRVVYSVQKLEDFAGGRAAGAGLPGRPTALRPTRPWR